jgi:tetratricopeptide (TPR) repeat protein
MDSEDAVELLLKSTMVGDSASNRDIGAAICDELGCLALAITQAGAYILHACSLGDYLQVYRKDRATLLQSRSGQAVDDYRWTVYTTWEMSLQKLSSSTVMLLRLFAFLHHERIPRAIFEKAAASEDTRDAFHDGIRFLANFRKESGEWSNQKFLNSIRELTAYSLINVDNDHHTYSIHPLVHAWARERVSLTECEEAQTCMLQLLALSVPTSGDLEGFAFRRAILPHLDQAYAGGLDAHIAHRLYYVFRDGGRWRVAGELLEAAVVARRNALGDEHQSTMLAMGDLALTYWNQGKWKEAEELEVLVLEMRRRILGDEHPDTILAMGNLASIYQDQGRQKEAEELKVQVLEMRRRVLGDEHPDTILAMGNLASTYWDQGRQKEAEELEVLVLEMRRRVLGDEHPDTILAMGNLASTYRDQGRQKEAEELEVLVLEMRRRVLGHDHPHTLIAMGNLAITYHKQQQWAKANRLSEQLLVLQRLVLGDDHPNTLATIGAIACLQPPEHTTASLHSQPPNSPTQFHIIKPLPSKLKDKFCHFMR